MKNILFIITLAGVLLSAQLGFGALINLETPAASQTDAGKRAVEGAVRTEGDKLASNATFLTTDLIDKLQADTTAVVNLSAVSAAAPVEIVTDLKAYAIGLGSVRLARVAVKGNRYDFSDTTVNPLLFSDEYVSKNTGDFTAKVDVLGSDQIAVIIAITMTPEEIAGIAGIKDRVEAGKVIIVQAVGDSKGAFAELFKLDPQNYGLDLRSLDRNNPAVVKALQGAV